MSPTERTRRVRKVLYVGATMLFSVLGVYLAWALRSLLLPTLIGALLAYISAPILAFGSRHGIRRGMGVLILFGSIALVGIALVRQVNAAMPDEQSKLELRVRAQYKLNERYEALMGLDANGAEGNVLYDFVGRDLDPGLDRLNRLLVLRPAERALFESYLAGEAGNPPVAERIVDYYRANLERAGEVAAGGATNGVARPTSAAPSGGTLASGLDAMALWVVTPFVFLILLIDDGRIKNSKVGRIMRS